jgi:hypothetical protein
MESVSFVFLKQQNFSVCSQANLNSVMVKEKRRGGEGKIGKGEEEGETKQK